jgi:hypothetical protein
VRALIEGSPSIAVGVVGRDAIALNPQTLDGDEAHIVAERLRTLLCSRP